MTHENEDIDIEFQQASPERLHLHNRRQLSAMLDGELSDDQARFMLRRLQHDAELAACWERWQVCGDVLRGRGHALLPADFSRRVAAAIAAPASEAEAEGSATPAAKPQAQHRLLRWGGGALAASVALVALFMARQLPAPNAQGPHEAASVMRTAPVLVEGPPAGTLATASGETPGAVGGDSAPASASQDGGSVLPALLAMPAAAVAVAEVPRRTGERGSTRSQAQRAALRRSRAEAVDPVQVAASALPPPPATAAGLPALAGAPAASGDDALFGALPPATTRPWPRAVLPGISRSQPFAAGYGLPQAEAFAPFQPRLDGDRFAPAPGGLPGRKTVDSAAGSVASDAGPGQ